MGKGKQGNLDQILRGQGTKKILGNSEQTKAFVSIWGIRAGEQIDLFQGNKETGFPVEGLAIWEMFP